MGIRVELEMLAVLLLLTPLVSDGLVMPKCQVVDQLMSNIPADVPDHDNLVAKLACHAEVTSNFATGLIKKAPALAVPGSRKTRSAPQNTKSPKTTKPPAKPSTKPPAKPSTKPPANPTTMPPAKPSTKPPANPTTMPPAKPSTKPPANPTTIPPAKPSTMPPANPTTMPPPNPTTMPPANPSTMPPANPSTMPPANPTTNPPPYIPQNPNVQHTDHQNNTHEPMLNQTKPSMPPHFNLSHTDEPSNYTHTDHTSNSSLTEGKMPPPPNFNPTNMNSRKKRDVGRLWTLYGVFQLADRVACTSPGTPSFNICKLSCDKLVDDDITDDINCALAIINRRPKMNPNPVGQDQDNGLLQTLMGMLLDSCPNKDYTQYLAECNNP